MYSLRENGAQHGGHRFRLRQPIRGSRLTYAHDLANNAIHIHFQAKILNRNSFLLFANTPILIGQKIRNPKRQNDICFSGGLPYLQKR